MKKKILSLTLVVCLLAIAVVGGTLAYFTDYTAVTSNTFTVGNVDITLDEAEVDVYGVDKGTRTDEGEGNVYKLIPGHTYVKDPTVTVVGGSEPCYVRMFVTFNKAAALETLFGEPFFPEKFVAGWDSKAWLSTAPVVEGDDTLTYEFRYFESVDARNGNVVLDDLFDTFTLPGNLTTEQVETLKGLQIDVVAEAIQADGLTLDDAWTKFVRAEKQPN